MVDFYNITKSPSNVTIDFLRCHHYFNITLFYDYPSETLKAQITFGQNLYALVTSYYYK